MVAEKRETNSITLIEKNAIQKIAEFGYTNEEATQILKTLEKYNSSIDDQYFRVITNNIYYDNEKSSTLYEYIRIPSAVSQKYYCINLKKKVLQPIILLVSKFEGLGLVSDILELANKFHFELTPEEICIYGYLKILEKNSQHIPIQLIKDRVDSERNECQEKEFVCRYLENDKCGLTEQTTDKVLDMLQKKDIIKRYSSWVEIIEQI